MRFDRLVLIVLLLVLPVAIWPGSTSYDTAKFTLLALAGACWLGSLAWRLVTGRSIPRPPLPLLIFGAGLLAIISASAVRAHNVSLVGRTLSLTVLWLAIVLQTAVASDSASRMRLILAAGVTSAVAVSLYGLVQMAGWLPGAHPSSGYPPGISTLGNQNYLSGLAAVLIWPSIILWNQKFASRQATAVIGTLVLVATVVMAGAAGPWLGVLGSTFLIAPALIMTSRGWTAKVPLILAVSLLVTGILAGVMLREAMLPPPQSGDQQVAVHRKVFLENSGALRRTNWLVAEEMFRSSPLTGRGAGNYAALWPEYRAALFNDRKTIGLDPFQPQAAQAHNEYFQFLGETGIMGAVWALAGLGLLLVVWNRTWRSLPDRQTQWQFLLLTAGLFVAGLHAMVSFPFHLPATAMALAMILGLLFSVVFRISTDAHPVWAGHRLLATLPAVACLLLGVVALRELVGDLHLAAGQQDFALARLEPASRRLTKGVDLSRWPGDGRLYLGLVQVATGQPNQARLSLENGLTEKPTFEGYLALAELSIDQGKFTEAAEMLAIVEGCEPNVDFRNQATYLRGLSELRQGRHEQAYDQIRSLLEADPTNQRAWLALGYLAVLAGEPGQAQNYYGRALEIIDRKIKDLESESGEPHPGEMVRLYSHRKTAQKALNSIK